MLRKLTIAASIVVLLWWARGGDSHALKREILQLRDGQTQFMPEDSTEQSDWGKTY